MTTLPTCPREDCTATVNHWHYRRPAGAVENCRGGRCGHCPTSSGSRCYAPRETAPPASPVPATDARTPQLASEPTPATSGPQQALTPIALPTVGEVVDIIKAGGFYSDTAQAVLDLIADRVPVWQPVQPGTVIKAGTRVRNEWTTGGEASEWGASEWDLITEWTLGEELPMDPKRRYWFDPRTVPAEPEDPRVAVVREWLKVCGPIDAGADDARDLLTRIDAARSDHA